MGWVNDALAELGAGRTVKIRPHGGSMRGRIESGQLVTLAPVSGEAVHIDDIVLVRVKGNYLLHLLKEFRGKEVLIGNAAGKLNGWVSASNIVGRVVDVAP